MENSTNSSSGFNKYLWAIPLVLVPIFFLWFSKGENGNEALYQQHCANCHMDNGQGLRGVIPPLAGADYLKNNTEQLPCILKYGMKGEIQVNGVSYNHEMPGNNTLSETEIANLINYINNSWGNKAPFVSESKVKEWIEKCEK